MSPQDWEGRLVLAFESLPHPNDGRRRVHVFRVQELAREEDVEERGLAVDGGSRRPRDGLVWAEWEDAVQINREQWYRTDAFRTAII